MQGWFLGVSMGDVTGKTQQDSPILHPLESFSEKQLVWSYGEAKQKSIFSMSGFRKESNVVFSLWLIPSETSMGRILCYKGTIVVNKLRFAYPSQMSVDRFKGKPNPKSLTFGEDLPTRKDILYHISLTSSAPEVLAMDMYYVCRFSYKRPGCADMHAQLRIYSLRVTLNEKLTSEVVFGEFLNHQEGHHIVTTWNDIYLGSAQKIQQRMNPFDDHKHRLYTWISRDVNSDSQKDVFSEREEYEKSIIAGFHPTTTPLGELLSPRAPPGSNIKTPRPASHTPRVNIVQPTFVADSIETSNPTRRLPHIINKTDDKLTFRLFNFKFTPPQYLQHYIHWKDFEASFQRTKAQSQIMTINNTKGPSREKEKRKVFSRKNKQEKNMTQLMTDTYLICRMERPIACNITLVILFKWNIEYVLLEKILLEVNNVDNALQLNKK